MSVQHTPGPWRWEQIKEGYARLVSETPEVNEFSPTGSIFPSVLTVDYAWNGYTRIESFAEISEADARLIAAAPELLDCLIHLQQRDWFKDGLTGEVVCILDADKVRAAIAKAKGEAK
jgi:hypothetical protein